MHRPHATTAARLRATICCLTLAACAGVAACASSLLPAVTVSRGQIDDALARRFPYHGSLLGVFSVDVRTPRLDFLADVDRLGADFDVSLTDRLGGHVYRGGLTIDGALRYDAGDHSLHLADTRLRSFSVAGLPADTQALLNSYGALLAAQAVGDLTLYTLKATDVQRMEAMGMRPGAIHVTPDGLTIAIDDLPASSPQPPPPSPLPR